MDVGYATVVLLSTWTGCPPVTSKSSFEIDNVIYSSVVQSTFTQRNKENIDIPAESGEAYRSNVLDGSVVFQYLITLSLIDSM